MAKESLITSEVKAAIGVEVTGPPELIELKAIKDFAKAINWPDPPNPLYFDEKYAKKTGFGGIIAPWSFYTSLGREVPRQRLPLHPARVGMNGGNDYEYFLPIRPGDVIITRSKIVDIVEREGRAGKLIITVSERTFTNQRGEVVGISRGTGISQY
jgi:acyl dehydratase